MRGLLKILAAVKLVELSEDERIALQENAPQDSVDAADYLIPAPTSVETSLPPPVFDTVDMPEGSAFEEIFKNAHIADSPFPAERLLRLLDGLRAMDLATRKAAVGAMDAADDNWTIADAVLDAQRKIAALEAYQAALESRLSSQEQKVAGDIADMKQAEEQAIAEIRKQIAEMERLLEREIQATAEHIAGLENGKKAAQEACAREVKRLQAEIARLREIPSQFAV